SWRPTPPCSCARDSSRATPRPACSPAARSSACSPTCPPAATSSKGSSPTRRRSSASCRHCWADSPAEVVQALVVDAEEVPDLVHDRGPHLLRDVLLRVADGADRGAVDGDPVRQRGRVVGEPLGERDPFVEPEEVGVGPVLDEDDDVAQQAGELVGQRVQRVGDELLEPVARQLDHQCPRTRRISMRSGTGYSSANPSRLPLTRSIAAAYLARYSSLAAEATTASS